MCKILLPHLNQLIPSVFSVKFILNTFTETCDIDLFFTALLLTRSFNKLQRSSAFKGINFDTKIYLSHDRCSVNLIMDVFAQNLLASNWINHSQHIVGILVFSVVAYYLAARKFFRAQKCIKQRVALVTGGGSGLGAAIALQLAKEGCNIAIVDINYKAAKKSVENLRNWGAKAEAYEIDVSSLKEIEEVKHRIELDLGKVSILVNNAAMLFTRSLDTESPEQIQKMINVNVMSVIWTTRVFLKTMIAQSYGHIITIASMAALTATPVGLPYTTSKFAVRGFMESLALDISHRGLEKSIKVTTVYPSFISTNNEVVKVYNVATKRRFFDTLYTPENIAKQVVNAIRTDKETLVIPGFCHYIGYAM